MKESTLENIRQKLNVFINHLCTKSKKLYVDKDKFELVFKYYYEYRKKIHKSMDISKHMLLNKKDKRMDCHKIASAFLCSILKAKPIGYSRSGEKPTFLERTANEQLGLILGIYIIYLFNLAKKDVTPIDKEIYGYQIKLPECKNNNDDDYITHFTKLIYDEKVKQNLDFKHKSFNITFLFFISHIFFLIDSFSYYKIYSTLNDIE